MLKSFKKLLLNNETKIGVWGSGYIGFTSAINFALNGVHTICFDINPKVVESINRGEVNMPNLEYWLGFPVKSLVKDGLIEATGNWKELIADNIRVHLIAIPTEKNGKPWDGPLKDVIGKIAQKKIKKGQSNLIIIESTLTPNEVDDVVIKIIEENGHKIGRDFLIGVAPRRDWFHSPEKNLKNLPRIIGGVTLQCREAMREVLEIICDHLIPASNHKIVELVKSVENSLLHIPAIYAIQLAHAYPDVDILEVLRLASTHWRIPHYYSSMGTGGYCIPVSSKYVVLGATKPEFLTISKETIKYDQNQPRFISELIAKHTKGKIAMLGITYKGDLKIHTLSPALTIIKHLRKLGRVVYAHDPYYTDEEILEITGCKTFEYPKDLSKFAAILIVPQHRMYTQIPLNILLKNLRPGQIILDNVGTWERHRDDFQKQKIIYHRIGDKGWCLW